MPSRSSRSTSSLMRSVIEMRSTTTSCVNVTLARDSTRSSDSISWKTGTSASGAPPGSACRPATSSALAPRGHTLRPATGRPPSFVAAVLVLLVLEQAPDQLLPRIELVVVVLGRRAAASSRRIGRHQLARLDVRQRRRHHQVLAGDVEVERAASTSSISRYCSVMNAIGMSRMSSSCFLTRCSSRSSGPSNSGSATW